MTTIVATALAGSLYFWPGALMSIMASSNSTVFSSIQNSLYQLLIPSTLSSVITGYSIIIQATNIARNNNLLANTATIIGNIGGNALSYYFLTNDFGAQWVMYGGAFGAVLSLALNSGVSYLVNKAEQKSRGTQYNVWSVLFKKNALDEGLNEETTPLAPNYSIE